MNKITLPELLERFNHSVKHLILAQTEKPGVTHLVVFENQQFDSSQFGYRTVVIIGKPYTYKTLDDVKGKHLNDLPSQRQYPVYYVEL